MNGERAERYITFGCSADVKAEGIAGRRSGRLVTFASEWLLDGTAHEILARTHLKEDAGAFHDCEYFASFCCLIPSCRVAASSVTRRRFSIDAAVLRLH